MRTLTVDMQNKQKKKMENSECLQHVKVLITYSVRILKLYIRTLVMVLGALKEDQDEFQTKEDLKTVDVICSIRVLSQFDPYYEPLSLSIIIMPIKMTYHKFLQL